MASACAAGRGPGFLLSFAACLFSCPLDERVLLTELDVSKVRARLELSSRYAMWLENLQAPAHPCFLTLPDDAEADWLLAQLGVEVVDRTACLAARPDPSLSPELWWIGSRAYRELIASMGWNPAIDRYMGWPGLPASTGPLGRHLYAWVFLAAVPDVRRFHHERGIPDTVSWQSLAQLGVELRQRRRVHNTSGLTATWTQPLVFRGASYRLGRHVFDRGSGGLNVHVPEGGPLDPESSQMSFDWARQFFPTCFPDERVTEFTCHSWLLDDQLARYLPANSNIIRFQRRFSLGSDDHDPACADRDILELVFHRTPDESLSLRAQLDLLPQDTTLQRAYIAHLRAGGHWRTRTGTSPF